LGLGDLKRLSKNKLRAGRSAGSPQSGYSLAQLARFGFRGSNFFCFVYLGIIRLPEIFGKKIEGWGSAGSPQS
jgi:hypothetical protein